MKKYFILLLCLIAGTVNAFEGSFSFSSEGISSVNNSPTLFNFSDELLEAVENCSSYQEDFTKNNPDISEIGALFGGDLSVYVDIKGQQNGKCVFDVSMDMGIAGQYIRHCQITPEQQKSLLAAMRDRTNEVFTETYESYVVIKDEYGKKKNPIQNTVTGNRFSIESGKIFAQSCETEQKELSEDEQREELEKFKNKFNSFSEEFKNSLQNCIPDTASRMVLFFRDDISIKGWEDGKCVLENKNFTFRISQDKLVQIRTWDDIVNLVKDKEISQYHYKNKYDKRELLFVLDKCSRQSGSNGSQSESFDDITVKTSLKYEQNSDGCILRFINVLERDGQEEDYSMVCSLSEEKVQEILHKYADLIEKYGEKITQEGTSFSFSSAKPNDETNAASAEIMAYLKENNLCSMVQDKGPSADEKESIFQEEEEDL